MSDQRLQRKGSPRRSCGARLKPVEDEIRDARLQLMVKVQNLSPDGTGFQVVRLLSGCERLDVRRWEEPPVRLSVESH